MFKRIPLIAVLAYYAVAQTPAQTKGTERGKQSGSFQLSISSDKDKYTSDEIILVTAVLTNVTDHTATLMRPNPTIFFYDMDVRPVMPDWMPVKPRVPLTPFGQKEMDPGRGSGSMGGGFAVGKELVDVFELNKLYAMTVPGEYRVRFSCRLPKQKVSDPRVIVTSNEIAIVIAGGQP